MHCVPSYSNHELHLAIVIVSPKSLLLVFSTKVLYDIHQNSHHVLFTHESILGAQNLSELNFILEKTILVRRLKDEVGLELPAKMRQTVIVQPSQKDAKAVKQLSEGLDRLQGSKDDNSSKQAKLLEMVSIPLTTGFYD